MDNLDQAASDIAGGTTGTSGTDVVAGNTAGSTYDPKFDPASDQFDPMSGFTCAPTQVNPTCMEKCKEQMEKNEEACDDFRKKVAEILKSRGCASVVRAYKKPSKKKCSKKKKTTKKKKSSCTSCVRR